MKPPFVSVIVPTYREWERLALCLNALAQQTYEPHHFEVLVVNNEPADEMPPHFVLPANATLLTEAKQGSYAARNAALKVAKGTIIAFTDADCIPNENWLKNAVTYLANNPHCSRIAGHIAIICKKPQPTTAEMYNAIFAFPQRSHAVYSGTGVTGNMITYKKVFDAVGLFNETLLSLGDLEWGKVAHKAGFRIEYVANVIIQHPARTLAELVKKEKRVGGGQACMAKQSGLRLWLNYLSANRPRIYIIKQVHRNSTGMGVFAKVKMLLLRHYLLNVRAAEKLRVHLGKQPSRA